MNENTKRIIELADGARTSAEIASAVGVCSRYVRKVIFRRNLPRPREGGQLGSRNHQFVCGRRVDLDGYVLVTVPSSHPLARQRTNRQTKLMYEHRLVMEERLGRHLLSSEVVDHVDGLTVHNAPSNLRLFSSNACHLRETLAGRKPQWSAAGLQNIRLKYHLPEGSVRIDTYSQRKALGEIRLQQILLAALSLGIDSPYLLGTHRHLEKARIAPLSRSTTERALAGLYEKWASIHALSLPEYLALNSPPGP